MSRTEDGVTSFVYCCRLNYKCQCKTQFRFRVDETRKSYDLFCNLPHSPESHYGYDGKVLAPHQRDGIATVVQAEQGEHISMRPLSTVVRKTLSEKPASGAAQPQRLYHPPPPPPTNSHPPPPQPPPTTLPPSSIPRQAAAAHVAAGRSAGPSTRRALFWRRRLGQSAKPPRGPTASTGGP